LLEQRSLFHRIPVNQKGRVVHREFLVKVSLLRGEYLNRPQYSYYEPFTSLEYFRVFFVEKLERSIGILPKGTILIGDFPLNIRVIKILRLVGTSKQFFFPPVMHLCYYDNCVVLTTSLLYRAEYWKKRLSINKNCFLPRKG